MPAPGDTICGEIALEHIAPSSLGAEAFQPVFIARDQARNNHLWLTVIDGSFVPTTVGMSTFMAGANTLLGIRHPALVRAVLVDREEDYCVVGYEQLPGAEPLADLVVRGGSRRVLARAAVEVARGLAFLHRGGLLHGALTPGTVMMWEGVPVLWEYGIASLCDSQVFGPRARSLGGDVVAPEVPTGAPLTPAADVYAWGAVMAAVASGELGSDGVSAVLEGDVDPGRHGALLGVVRQALSPEPSSRPRDGVHLLELLQRALASIDPSTDLGGAAEQPSADEGALRELALRYLAEMDDVPAGRSPSGSGGSPVAAPASSPGSGNAPGALGRVALVKKPAHEATGPKPAARNRPWLTGAPIKEVNRREPSGLHVTGPTAKEPVWDHRLPSDAQAQVPKTQGPGLVRGPEPGVSGSDAGMLAAQAKASESEARWVSPKVTASGWLRAAPRKEGVGGLFNERAPMDELDDGVRKRSVLRPGSRPSAPSARPRRAGVPATLPSEEVTPAEPLDLGEPAPPPMPEEPDGLFGLEQPSVDERETPPDVEVYTPSEEPPPPPEPEEEELPPAPDLPPMPAGAEPEPSESLPNRSKPVEPFRPPRRPGPHGPSAVMMGVIVSVLSGVIAIGATLSASSARGGFDKLLGVGAAAVADSEGAEATGESDGDEAVAAGPCPQGMVEINAEIDDSPARYCIDRSEFPGVDQMPTTDIDLSRSQQACEGRGLTLCSEAQWTRACVGDGDWKFPYGPRREAGRCLVGDSTASPGPTGRSPHCVTPDGVLDMVGNAAEWTAGGIVMGGSVRSKKTAGCATRQRLKPSTKRPTLGFRCCKVLPAPASEASDESAGEG